MEEIRDTETNKKLIDIETLLQPVPITEENTNECGKWLKYDYIYDQIKELRREDDPRLTQGVWLIEPKKASWNDVKKVCESALKTKSKDLQIATWWLEAMVSLHGFTGLNLGIELLYELCKRYWDNLWPAIDTKNKDFSARIAPFYFFTEKIADKILLIPLTYPQDITSNIFSLSDWITARHNLHIKNSTGFTVKDFKKSVSTTPIEFLKNIEKSLSDSDANLRKLDNLLTELCKNDAPSFRIIYEHFNAIKQINAQNFSERKKIFDAEEIKRRAKIAEAQNSSKNIVSEIEMSEQSESADNDNEQEPKTPTIEQAYSALNEIAVFLEEHQPQSPSSTLIKIASSIGTKTFQELLEINMQNGTTLVGTISELYKVLKQSSSSPTQQNNEINETK